jgi:hypothetical protein
VLARELPRYGERLLALRRSVVRRTDRLEQRRPGRVSDGRDGDRARRVLEHRLRLIAAVRTQQLVRTGRADHEHVGLPADRELVEACGHGGGFDEDQLRVDVRLVAQRLEASQCTLGVGGLGDGARTGPGIARDDLDGGEYELCARRAQLLGEPQCVAAGLQAVDAGDDGVEHVASQDRSSLGEPSSSGLGD